MNMMIRKIINKLATPFLRKIDKSVHITGKRCVEIGKHTMISQNTWLNVNERGDKKRIILGDYNFIGRNNFFSSGEVIEFGDFVITSVNCCFIGSQHKYESPYDAYLFSATECKDTIKIGPNCFIGANVTIMGNVSVGMGSLIGVNTFVRNMEIPPFSVVVGTENAKVIKRFSFKDNFWKKIADWTEEDEDSIPSEEEYLKKVYENVKGKWPNKIPLPLKAVGNSNGDLYL